MKFKHLEEVNISYVRHFFLAFYISSVLFSTSIKTLIHGFYPDVFKTVATDNVEWLSCYLKGYRTNKKRKSDHIIEEDWINIDTKKIDTNKDQKHDETLHDEHATEPLLNTQQIENQSNEINSVSNFGLKFRNVEVSSEITDIKIESEVGTADSQKQVPEKTMD